MDINLPGINGIEATRRIVAADDTDTTVILLSTYTQDDLPADAHSCGAVGVRAQGGPQPRSSLRELLSGPTTATVDPR